MTFCYHATSIVLPPLAFLGNAGIGEILVVLLVLLLLFGARRLPELARSLGRAVGELRRASQDLTREIMLDAPPTAKKDTTTDDNSQPPEYEG